MRIRALRSCVVFGLVALLLPACTSYRYTRKADQAIKSENWDAAVYYYLEALADDPGNAKFKMELQRARLRAGDIHFRAGMRFHEAGEQARALSELELAVQFDPTNQYAEVELAKVRKEVAILQREGGAQKLAEMKKAAAEMKVKPPILNPASDEPLSLSFPNQTNARDIYKAIGQAFGFNILFDPKMKETRIAIELKNVNARQALEAVMQAAGHFYKVLDETTVIVVEDSPQNRRDYEDLVVKTFFLSNADVKDVNNMLRQLIDARRIAVNEQLNSVVIRDTADKVAIAERLIAANDKSKAEVLVDVELIQVNSTKVREIGTELQIGTGGGYSYNFGVDATKLGAATATGGVSLDRLGDITRSMWSTVIPSITLNLIKSASEAETLAHPQLRITEREKASLVIGDQVPIPTTTFNSSQTIGGNIVPITAFQYKDVGIKIDIEPRVHHNNEVTLKLKVELSEQTGVVTFNGQDQPKFGTRTIDATIRLKDGETSLLAGLYKYARNDSESGIPWLSDLPVVGHLFGDKRRDFAKTDLVLTLTPHIIRNPDITEEDLAPLWVGTENRITIFGNSPRLRSAGDSTAAPGADTAVDNMGVGVDFGVGQAVRLRENTGRRIERGGGGGGGDNAPVQPPPADKETRDRERQDAPPAAGGGAVGSVVTFYPARLPLLVGRDGEVKLVADVGVEGLSGPLHFAYDALRLDVVSVEAGSLPGGEAGARTQINHVPAMGWITVDWQGEATGSFTLCTLHVRPRVAGEIPVVFAGPLGTLGASSGTVIGLSEAGLSRLEAAQP